MKIKANGEISVGSIAQYLNISQQRQDEIAEKIFKTFTEDNILFHDAIERVSDIAQTNEELFLIGYECSMFMSKFHKMENEKEALKKLLGILKLADDEPKTKTIN